MFLAKLERNHEHGDLQRQGLIEIRDKILSMKQLGGPIGRVPKDTPEHFWFLVQFSDITSRLDTTVNYLLSSDFKDIANPSDLGVVILALHDHDFNQFESEINHLGELLIEKIGNDEGHIWVDKNKEDGFPDPYACSRVLMTLPRLPQEVPDLINKISESVVQYWGNEEDWMWEQENVPISLGYSFQTDILLGLIAAGYGKKISAEEVRWEAKIREQRRSRFSPKFVTTLPSTRFKTRKMEIRNEIKRMIQSTQDSLSISTLQMDMLHDDLIDCMNTTDDILIRILTNTGTASGPRTKMKKAVMNEMVQRLDGSVREDRLIHTRMVIRDQEEALISTADLTRDQLQDSFNAGIHTRDPKVVRQA